MQAMQTADALAEECGQRHFLALDWSQRQGLLALLPDALVLIAKPSSEIDQLPVAAQYAEWSPDCMHVLLVSGPRGFLSDAFVRCATCCLAAPQLTPVRVFLLHHVEMAHNIP